MPRSLTSSPTVKSSPRDDGWYATPQGRRRTEAEFARALKDGTLVRSTGSSIRKTDRKVLEQLMEQAK